MLNNDSIEQARGQGNRIGYHMFSVDDAERYGVNKAILLYHLRFWISHNRANKKNIYTYRGEKSGFYGRTFVWTYNSARAFRKQLPYMSERSILRWLSELEDEGVLLSTSDFNKHRYDKTKWYTIVDECEMDDEDANENTYEYADNSDESQRQFFESQRQFFECQRQFGEPIPDIKPDIIPDKYKEKKEKNKKEKKESMARKRAGVKEKKFSPEGAEIIKKFEEVDPKNKRYYNNKTQRECADFLIETYGKENVLQMIDFIKELQRSHEKYAPIATSPYELVEKWAKIVDYVRRKNVGSIILSGGIMDEDWI